MLEKINQTNGLQPLMLVESSYGVGLGGKKGAEAPLQLDLKIFACNESGFDVQLPAQRHVFFFAHSAISSRCDPTLFAGFEIALSMSYSVQARFKSVCNLFGKV